MLMLRDDIDRLIEADYPTFSAEEWTYDPLGNRITDAATGEEPWQYNENNELLSSVEYSYEYDANGSLIAEYHPDGTLYRSHEYNAETRLTAVRDSQGDLIAEYTYDPLGRRVSKTVYDPPGESPETTWYLYTDQGLLAELDEQGNQQDFYLFPPDGLWSTAPVLRKSDGSYFYYQTDHLGTPQQLVDRSGSVVHSREMRAFGEVASTGMEDRWRFPGQLESAETGLYYNYFRDYAPGLGRYVQSDPIGTNAGPNVFIYASSNPVLFLDALGLKSSECCEREKGSVAPWGAVSIDASASLFFGGSASAGFLTNGLTLERCFYTLTCTRYGLSAGLVGGLSIGMDFSGPWCGNEFSESIQICNIVVEGAAGLKGLSLSASVGGDGCDGSGSFSRGVGPSVGFGFTIGTDFCTLRVRHCWGSECECD